MKNSGKVLMAAGVAIMIIGFFVYRNLNHVSAVDSNSWTINLNGINSFPWVIFTGFVILMVGISFVIATAKEEHHRVS
jgi:uncharacterized membrane protein